MHETDSRPGPKYSTIAPVPPFTVRIPATFRMTSETQKKESLRQKSKGSEFKFAIYMMKVKMQTYI